jgi:hypothetical protein
VKRATATKYNKKVRPRSFVVGDQVLRQADIGKKNDKDGKLVADWEGSYKITSATEKEHTNSKHSWANQSKGRLTWRHVVLVRWCLACSVYI